MSTHEIPVVRIKAVKPHPNADQLGLVRVFGWTCAVRLGEFAPGDLAVYVPPDYLVDTARPEFAFLAQQPLADGPPVPPAARLHRVKVKRLRGVYSQGLLIKAPTGLSEGDNALDQLEIIRYEPSIQSGMGTGGDAESGPGGVVAPKYDVENLHRYRSVFIEHEPVVVTEKLHGANGRYVWSAAAGRIYCGSRTNWKREDEQNMWWRALRQNPWVEAWCAAHPDAVLYGEVFGQVQDLKYGAKPGQLFFVAFDVYSRDAWMPRAEADAAVTDDGRHPERWAPVVYRGPFNVAKLAELADALDSQWPGAKHCAEGLVIRPVRDRHDNFIGQVQLKIVSNRYLCK